MPDSKIKLIEPSDSASDEASKLELYLQRQLEEDIARIFDESIYSDLEVVCGKLKILTHSCILRARTNIFYSKLDSILRGNIGREIFDEIYSFISDAYTECNIKQQEKDILIFLKSKVFTCVSDSNEIKDNADDVDVYLTPNCISPCTDSKYQQISCLSPSTELTKEYYALVHIEGNLLEQELIEQDALSNAFHTIIKSQDRDLHKIIQHNKPTSLSLISSHCSKTIKHSNKCDNNKLSNELKDSEKNINKSKSNQSTDITQSNNVCENKLSKIHEILDPTYSPDSLITDDPSSSSDYLSAAYTCSPALGSSGCLPQLNVGENSNKMENNFTSSDSGLGNTVMLESLTSSKDITLTDISLTDSTLHDLTTEDINNSQGLTSSPDPDLHAQKTRIHPGASSYNGISGSASDHLDRQRNVCLAKHNDLPCCKSSKDEKQRKNEEIVILESSSVSSETGSWESIFPPKLTDKEICDKFIYNERMYNCDAVKEESYSGGQNLEKILIKYATPCFIDAASLVDEEQVSIQFQNVNDNSTDNVASDVIHTPSKPVPCSASNKPDISISYFPENNENDDSLEQGDNNDEESIQMDLSPTIFEMTPIKEDSLCENIPINSINSFNMNTTSYSETSNTVELPCTDHVHTPQNSMWLLETPEKPSNHDEGNNDIRNSDTFSSFNSLKFYESTPLVSIDRSIEESTPRAKFQNSNTTIRKKIHNTPVTAKKSSNYEKNKISKKLKPTFVSAWVVDMSSPKETELEIHTDDSNCKKPTDKKFENLKNETKPSNSDNCKSCSLDSDSSEKSGHNFFIDLNTLPDHLPADKVVASDPGNQKKNMFSLFFDLGKNTTLKKMPSRLSSSFSNKEQTTERTSCPKPQSPRPLNIETLQRLRVSAKKDTPPKCLDGPNQLGIMEMMCVRVPLSIPAKVNEIHEIDNNENEKPSTSFRRANGDKSTILNTVNVIHEKPVNKRHQSTDLFVKLSDLDNPTSKSNIFDTNTNYDQRMTKSIPDKKWSEQNVQTISSRSSEVISSFHSENALSLNRIFPHLKTEFSKSMPVSLSGRVQSPLRPGASSSVGEIFDRVSDISETSSIQSSVCRSVIENSTTEETSQTSSLIGNCQSSLGQDLLRMFVEEIAPDVIVEVSGRRIQAHKCILSSRCQYFAGILSGGWVESAGNVIVLPPFSYSVVHFVLCHIYSGLSTIPDSISIVELATIADMLGLEGLKEAIMFTLKAKYCHHFHEPCQVCTAGVLECLTLSSVYGLDDLYRKCLRWITKYFTKVWPTKAFATLPKELLDKCFHEHVVNLTYDNFVDTVYGCGITMSSLQNSRWAENVAKICRRLLDAAANYAAAKLLHILEMLSSYYGGPPPAARALNECIASAIQWAPANEACRAYGFLSYVVKDIEKQRASKPDLIIGNDTPKISETSSVLFTHAEKWLLQCELAIVQDAPSALSTRAYDNLDKELRMWLRKLGCTIHGPVAIPPPRLFRENKKSKSPYISPYKSPYGTKKDDHCKSIEEVRKSFIPYKPKPATVVGSKTKLKSNRESKEFKKTENAAPKVRTTKAQEQRLQVNLSKATHTSHLSSVNTKSRYLQPRPVKEAEKKPTLKDIKTASRDSGRYLKPVHYQNARTSRLTASEKCAQKAHVRSQESLATNSSRPRTAEPSLSESQNSNRYATYTKTKHDTKGSVESVASKSQGASSSSLLNAKIKTKIPIYLNRMRSSSSTNKQQNSFLTSQMNVPTTGKDSDHRKVSGSLMNATKSSSAKIVPKIAKDSSSSRSTTPKAKASTSTSKQTREGNGDKPSARSKLQIPTMDRSGTFSKDESTFGDKNTY